MGNQISPFRNIIKLVGNIILLQVRLKLNQTAFKAVQDKATQDKATQDKATQDKAVQDKATQDKATHDKATQDKATQDKATQDKATHDKAAPKKLEIMNKNLLITSHRNPIYSIEESSSEEFNRYS